ncbi:MAG TPA: ATP-binding protein [Burkholderiales bacterium]
MLHVTQAEMMQAPAGYAGPLQSTIDPAALTGPWAAVELPHTFFGHWSPPAAAPGGRPALVTRWYRVRPGAYEMPSHTASLFVVRGQMVGNLAIYGDGRLLFRSRGSLAWNVFRHPAVFVPLSQAADMPPPKELLIRIDAVNGSTGALSTMWVGDGRAVYGHYAWRLWGEYEIPFMLSAAFLAVGLFSLGVWCFRRGEPIYLLFFGIALCTVLRRWHFYEGIDWLPLPDPWFIWLTMNALTWQTVLLHRFFEILHRRHHPWLGRTLLVLAVLCTLATIPAPLLLHGLVQFRQTIYGGLILANTVVIGLGWYDSWRARSHEGLVLAIGHAVALFMGTYDWVKFNSHLIDTESIALTPYVTGGLFALFGYVMFRRYVRALGHVEEVNASLEASLAAREAELAESYRLLRVVEQRETLNRERARLVQDMHDGLGSSLMTALRVVEHGRADEAAVAEVLRACIDDLKLTIDSMEPVQTDLLLLLATLRFRLGPRLEHAGITLRWEVNDVPALDWLEPRNALHILRILQEAFTNVIKHTRAREICVTTGLVDDGIQVTVADNGPGFVLADGLKQGGRGLGNQLRRAEAIGARLAIRSDDEGTRFSLWLPLRMQSAAAASGATPASAAATPA